MVTGQCLLNGFTKLYVHKKVIRPGDKMLHLKFNFPHHKMGRVTQLQWPDQSVLVHVGGRLRKT